MNQLKKGLFVIQSALIRLSTFGCFYLLYPVWLLLPIQQKKIVVCSYFGKGYGDNPKYICDYLLQADPTLDIVWLCTPEVMAQQQASFPPNIRLVRYKSFRALLEMHTAKIWIDNCRKRFYPRKRKQQFYLQTWHAGFGLKRIENNATETLNTRYINFAKKDSQMCDLLVFESSNLFEDIGRMFWYDGPIFRKGIPRNDLLVNPQPEITAKVYQYFDLPAQKKLVLYAPTFRNDYDLQVNADFLAQVVQTFSQRFAEDYVLLLRLHPNDTKKKAQILAEVDTTQILDASAYPDMQELLSAIDTLITDYSSTIGEMLVANKKCFLYAYDYEAYQKDRGLVMDLHDLPFPVALSEAALLQAIETFDDTAYHLQVTQFNQRFHIEESGHASQELGDILINVMKS